MSKLTWLVTGCSSGIGEALIHAILNKGDQAIATARPSKGLSGEERLESLKNAGATVLELDVTASNEDINQKAQEAWAKYGQVDVLVNNAGYIEAGMFEELDEATILKSVTANALGPLNLTRAFLPLMRQRKTGTILFSSSLGMYHGAPGASAYSAAKGLLEGLVPNLALEVAPFGIRTSILTFGHFRTKVMAPGNMQYLPRKRPQSDLLPEYREINELVESLCSENNGQQIGDPAKAGVLIVDAVKGEGLCQGKELPLRLPIGSDTFEKIRANSEEKLELCDEWSGITSETDF